MSSYSKNPRVFEANVPLIFPLDSAPESYTWRVKDWNVLDAEALAHAIRQCLWFIRTYYVHDWLHIGDLYRIEVRGENVYAVRKKGDRKQEMSRKQLARIAGAIEYRHRYNTKRQAAEAAQRMRDAIAWAIENESFDEAWEVWQAGFDVVGRRMDVAEHGGV